MLAGLPVARSTGPGSWLRYRAKFSSTCLHPALRHPPSPSTSMFALDNLTPSRLSVPRISPGSSAMSRPCDCFVADRVQTPCLPYIGIERVAESTDWHSETCNRLRSPSRTIRMSRKVDLVICVCPIREFLSVQRLFFILRGVNELVR